MPHPHSNICRISLLPFPGWSHKHWNFKIIRNNNSFIITWKIQKVHNLQINLKCNLKYFETMNQLPYLVGVLFTIKPCHWWCFPWGHCSGTITPEIVRKFSSKWLNYKSKIDLWLAIWCSYGIFFSGWNFRWRKWHCSCYHQNGKSRWWVHNNVQLYMYGGNCPKKRWWNPEKCTLGIIALWIN